MSGAEFLQAAVLVAIALLSLAMGLTVVFIVRGPTLPDRVMGLDLLVLVGIGIIAAVAVRTGFPLYLDVAIALGLVGFLATVAFARYVMQRRKAEEAEVSGGSLP